MSKPNLHTVLDALQECLEAHQRWGEVLGSVHHVDELITVAARCQAAYDELHGLLTELTQP